jgi:hypothetical protein
MYLDEIVLVGVLTLLALGFVMRIAMRVSRVEAKDAGSRRG